MTAQKAKSSQRVIRHRTGLARAGSRRVEVVVPERDAALVRSIAATLREGGTPARRLRGALDSVLIAQKPRTGAELLAFFRASPLVGADIAFDRDHTAGRPIDL